MAVLSPFLAKRFCTAQTARNTVYLLLIVSLIFVTTTFFFFYDLPVSRAKQHCLLRQKYFKSHRIHQIVLFYAIPDFLLLSNIFTIYSLFKRRQQQQQASSEHPSDKGLVEMRVSDVHSSRKQRQLTIMLVTVNIVFYAFTTPATVMFFMEIFPPKDADTATRKRRMFFDNFSVPLSQLPNAVSLVKSSYQSNVIPLNFSIPRLTSSSTALPVNDFVEQPSKRCLAIQSNCESSIIATFGAINSTLWHEFLSRSLLRMHWQWCPNEFHQKNDLNW